MTTQEKTAASADTGTRGDLAGTVFAAGGFLAAFGVAACCALPLALSLLGISAASLVTVGMVTAPYQRELFYAAVVLVLGAAFVMWRRRRALACHPGTVCARPAFDRSSKAALLLATGLLVLTSWIDLPI